MKIDLTKLSDQKLIKRKKLVSIIGWIAGMLCLGALVWGVYTLIVSGLESVSVGLSFLVAISAVIASFAYEHYCKVNKEIKKRDAERKQ